MRSIAFIWVVALISAALAQGASAQEKIQLAQSSTVPNHPSRARAGDAPSQPQQQSTLHS
jgi:hypothetical protein